MTAAPTLNPITLNAIAQTSALQIVNCLVEGTVIAICAGAVLRAARLRNSSSKFAVWFSALMGIAALPALIGISGASLAHGTSSAHAASHAAITLSGSWALFIFVAWAAVATWSLIGVARSLWHLRVLRRSCVPVDPTILDTRVRETLARNGPSKSASSRPAALCTSDLVHVPTAIGLVKPAVVLPSWILQELPPQDLNQILLHELAHLRRWDDWTNLAQKLVKALFFFHPAVWWIERQVSLEREMACDDAVVAETASPRAYAECLAHLAEKTLLQRRLAQRSVALAQAALGRIRHTSLRVAQILDGNRRTGTANHSKPAVAFVAAFAIASVAWISKAPRLIAFQDRDVASTASSTVAHTSPASELRELQLSPAPLAPVVPASFIVPATHRSFESSKHSLAIHPRVSTPVTASAEETRSDQRSLAEKYFPQTNSLQTNLAPSDVRLPYAAVAPVALTETIFVVVESPQNGSSDQPVFQIQWWQVMVLHPAVDPDSNRIPPKKT